MVAALVLLIVAHLAAHVSHTSHSITQNSHVVLLSY